MSAFKIYKKYTYVTSGLACLHICVSTCLCLLAVLCVDAALHLVVCVIVSVDNDQIAEHFVSLASHYCFSNCHISYII